MVLVGLGRLELPTSRLSGVRSNHLSYRPQSIEAVGRSRIHQHPAGACYSTAEERETKEADPALYGDVGHDLSHIFVLKRFNMSPTYK